ncbi:hypothetical protein HK101_002582 [Irineochytrium annulatum]|nr:hypothetical protein HK101_002582 [Irineochytrium annulatum]
MRFASQSVMNRAERAGLVGFGDLPIAADSKKVTTVSVKLGWPYQPQSLQLAVTGLLQALKEFEGVYHQVSVDERGQTLLAWFGLPVGGYNYDRN